MLKKKRKLRVESRLKYFLTQAMASVVIVTTCILLHRGYTLLMFNILGAFFLKIGVAPFHQ